MTAPTMVLDPPSQARLLAGGGTDLVEHRRRHPRPLVPRPTPRTDLIELVERSGLTGRGGAGFPTGGKLRSVAAGRGPRVVVVNGAEGEPASAKDRVLLAQAPHLVIDGALVAAAAVGAARIVICIDRAHTQALRAVRHALSERAAELVGVEARLAASPSRYVSGESSALVQWIEGGPGVPRGGCRAPARSRRQADAGPERGDRRSSCANRHLWTGLVPLVRDH